MTTIMLVDFTKFPLGRFKGDSSGNGQDFREKKLLPALQDGSSQVTVNLDGAKVVIGSSFLEEAFGGLIRHNNFTLDELKKQLKIITSNEMYRIQIDKFLNTAEMLRLKKNNQ